MWLSLCIFICFFLSDINALTIHLCGTTSANHFYCNTIVDGVVGNWENQNGSGWFATVDGNILIVSNQSGKLYFKTIGTSSWNHRGYIRHLSSYNRETCGFIDVRLGLITCANVVDNSFPSWYILNYSQAYASRKLFALSGIKAPLKHYYIPIEGSIHSQVATADEATKLLIQISYDGSTLCGVTASKDAYCATQGLPHYPVFVQIPGNDFEYISVQLDAIFAIRAGNAVYQTTNPATTWTDMNQVLVNIASSHVP